MASSKQRGFEQSQAVFMRELSLDPVNVAATVVFNLAVLAGALVVSLSGAAVAVEDRGAIKAGRALAFCRNNVGDATKLFLVNVCVGLPKIVIDRVATLLTVTGTSRLFALGVATSVLLAYTAVLNFGFAVSLYAARRPLSESAA